MMAVEPIKRLFYIVPIKCPVLVCMENWEWISLIQFKLLRGFLNYLCKINVKGRTRYGTVRKTGFKNS
jgi:hypothetical protein